MGRNTFGLLLNTLAPQLTKAETPTLETAFCLRRFSRLGSFDWPTEILILISISPAMNVGKSTVIEAVQDVVEGLYELRNEYIKFPETGAETASIVQTFEELSALACWSY